MEHNENYYKARETLLLKGVNPNYIDMAMANIDLDNDILSQVDNTMAQYPLLFENKVAENAANALKIEEKEKAYQNLELKKKQAIGGSAEQRVDYLKAETVIKERYGEKEVTIDELRERAKSGKAADRLAYMQAKSQVEQTEE